MRQLTEKQQKFLDVLFDQAAGSVAQAKKLIKNKLMFSLLVRYLFLVTEIVTKQ